LERALHRPFQAKEAVIPLDQIIQKGKKDLEVEWKMILGVPE
jgi:hypothetical protein